MANKSTITYNGATIATEERDGDFAVVYNGSTIATIAAGATKTLKCAGKVMATDVLIGGKTLKCSGKLMATDVVIAVASLFPSAPSAYNLIGTYSISQTWTAPESGYFQIEVFGASGSGAIATTSSGTYRGGGGGGGGGYSASRVTLNKGDTIVLTVGAVSYTTSAVVNSSHNNSYDHTLQVTSGVNSSSSSGSKGGTASGGNYANTNGGDGQNGNTGTIISGCTGGTGGTGANGAPNGGNGGSKKGLAGGTDADPTMGSPGFFKIYRGNTNVSGGGNADLPAYDAVLANNSWETISQIARLGKASEIWNIGDTKPMTIAEYTYNAQIVAFDHYDIADSASYGRAQAGIVFQLAEFIPVNKDRAEALQYVPEVFDAKVEFIDLIPIVSYPQAASGSSSTSITTMQAKAFIASEFEIFGEKINSVINEGTQYAYYAAGNSKTKYRPNSTTAGNYWTRSYKSASTYVYINTSGESKYGTGSYFAVPVFCL